MTDHNTKQRQEWLDDLQANPDDSAWWWAIAIALLFTLVMLAASIPA